MTTPGHTPEEEWMACAVCSRVLAKKDEYLRGKYVGSTWDHEAIDYDRGWADHPPVPVPYNALASVAMVCDFCSERNPTWELPVEDFVMPRFYANGDDWGSTNNWMACGKCAALLNRGLWPQLTRRAIKFFIRNSGGGIPVAVIESDLKAKYALVRKHQKGPVRLAAEALREMVEGKHWHEATEEGGVTEDLGTVRWFGESWGAPACDPRTHIETPTGMGCIGHDHMHPEGVRSPFIEPGDQGITLPQIPAPGEPIERVAYHLDCWLHEIGADRSE